MFIDYPVEPFYYERGIDFYENGQNYSLAPLPHVTQPTLLKKGAFDRLLAGFQRVVKEKTPEALDELVDAAHASR